MHKPTPSDKMSKLQMCPITVMRPVESDYAEHTHYEENSMIVRVMRMEFAMSTSSGDWPFTTAAIIDAIHRLIDGTPVTYVASDGETFSTLKEMLDHNEQCSK